MLDGEKSVRDLWIDLCAAGKDLDGLKAAQTVMSQTFDFSAPRDSSISIHDKIRQVLPAFAVRDFFAAILVSEFAVLVWLCWFSITSSLARLQRF